MNKIVKIILIIISYIVVAGVSLFVGAKFSNNINSIIDKNNDISVSGKTYSGYHSLIEKTAVYIFIDNNNLEYIEKEGDNVVTKCGANYMKQSNNQYYYQINECELGYVIGNYNPATISVKENYFCINKNDCNESERYTLVK